MKYVSVPRQINRSYAKVRNVHNFQMAESQVIYSACMIIENRKRPRLPPGPVVSVPNYEPRGQRSIPGVGTYFSVCFLLPFYHFNAELIHANKMK